MIQHPCTAGNFQLFRQAEIFKGLKFFKWKKGITYNTANGHLSFSFCLHNYVKPYILEEGAIVHFSPCPFYLERVYLDLGWQKMNITNGKGEYYNKN